MDQRHVKLFRDGRNQAVRIPCAFELPGEDAVIRSDGEWLIRKRYAAVTVDVSGGPEELWPNVGDGPNQAAR